jgi:hypothetical protein
MARQVRKPGARGNVSDLEKLALVLRDLGIEFTQSRRRPRPTAGYAGPRRQYIEIENTLIEFEFDDDGAYSGVSDQE